jgi:hypothetical protein
MPAFEDILPPPDDPELLPLHDRDYIVRAYRRAADTLVIRGAVRDQKPPGLYIPEDVVPLTIHHMVVEIAVAVTTMEITSARAVMETHPNELCPGIEPHYDNLVGLSIARGFTHKIRELFGGPRGCTHITALLQAMAPVAVQSLWSLRVANTPFGVAFGPRSANPEDRERSVADNLNTCHVWAEDGEYVARVRAGGGRLPISIRRRLSELGHDPDDWRR